MTKPGIRTDVVCGREEALPDQRSLRRQRLHAHPTTAQGYRENLQACFLAMARLKLPFGSKREAFGGARLAGGGEDRRALQHRSARAAPAGGPQSARRRGRPCRAGVREEAPREPSAAAARR